MSRVLLIDNYDSFTYNLAQALMVLGAEVLVHRNDQLTVAEALDLAPTHLVISPGPGHPRDAGVSKAMIGAFHGSIPVLGVCLGHQALTELFGGAVGHAPYLMHGKASLVDHQGEGLFAGLPQPMQVARYHSLLATEVPKVLQVTARTQDGLVMGLRHREAPTVGVQFHPESVLTPEGPALLQNFLSEQA